MHLYKNNQITMTDQEKEMAPIKALLCRKDDVSMSRLRLQSLKIFGSQKAKVYNIRR